MPGIADNIPTRYTVSVPLIYGSMLTIFATPKAFKGHIGTIQQNAITSWTKLHPRPEIILFGDEAGTAEIAQAFDLQYIPDVERNDHGTPLVRSMFQIAQERGKGSLFCYVNCDIVLMGDFMQTIQMIPFERFMLSGQRMNLDVTDELTFDQQWEHRLCNQVSQSGQLQGPHAMDYFVFPRGVYTEVPAFAVGRACWDNWMLYHALNLNIPMIDATDAITAVHQNHDYNHHPQGRQGVYEGTEAQRSLELIGGRSYVFFMLDLANWKMNSQGLQRPTWTRGQLHRLMEMLPLVRPGFQGWAALLKHLMDYHFHADLDEGTLAQLYQGLGEAFFSRRDRWFWFSMDLDDAEPVIYLPPPAEREKMDLLRRELDQTQRQVEHLSQTIQAMESSKFWKLRSAWVQLKQRLDLKKSAMDG